EMLGRPTTDFIFPEDLPPGLSAMHPWQQEIIGKWTARLRHKDFGESHVLGSVVPISDDHGNASGSLVTFMDITDMKRLQDSTRLAQDRLDRALKVSPVILFNQDRDLRYTWAYGSTDRFTAEEMCGKCDAELFPPEAAERLRAIKEQVLESGTRARAIVDLPLPSAHVYIDLIVEPLRGQGQQSGGITGVAMDITERMALTQELSEAREQLEEAINSTRTVLWSWNVENGELRYSRNATAIFGLSAGARATTLEEQLDKVPADDAQEIRRQIAKAVAQKGPINAQFRYLSRDTGKEFWFEARGHFSYNHIGQARFLRGVLYDITDRKQIEEVIRANEKRFRHIVENTPDPQVMLDEHGIIQCVSRAAASKLGYSTEDLVGEPVLSLVSHDQRNHVLDQAQKFLDSKREAFAGLVRVCRRDRSMLWAEVDVSRILAGHAVQGFLVRFTELDLGYYTPSDPRVQVHSHGLP
ncbi:PAS domain S-box protein, partial [bacterium]